MVRGLARPDMRQRDLPVGPSLKYLSARSFQVDRMGARQSSIERWASTAASQRIIAAKLSFGKCSMPRGKLPRGRRSVLASAGSADRVRVSVRGRRVGGSLYLSSGLPSRSGSLAMLAAIRCASFAEQLGCGLSAQVTLSSLADHRV